MEESHKTHRPHIKVGKDEEKKKKNDIGLQEVPHNYDLVTVAPAGTRVQQLFSLCRGVSTH